METYEKVHISKRGWKNMLRESGIRSNYQLSQLTGISQSTLSKWKNGHLTLPYHHWQTIKKYLVSYEQKK